jgi:hypothetical protein
MIGSSRNWSLRSVAAKLLEARRLRLSRRRLGGRGGPGDQPVATGGDGHQAEPATPRD